MNKPKKEPWRIATAAVSIAVIVFLWTKKDVAAVYATAPKEQLIPLIATSIAVSLFKVALIAAVVFLVKWIIGKVNKK